MASFQSTFGKSIQDSFNEFHKANPHVYAMFKREVFKCIKQGKIKLSSKKLINEMRWDRQFTTEGNTLFTDMEETRNFKVNDAFTSRYARLFINDFPEHKDIFKLKTIRSI